MVLISGEANFRTLFEIDPTKKCVKRMQREHGHLILLFSLQMIFGDMPKGYDLGIC